jgi:hypothetical protein
METPMKRKMTLVASLMLVAVSLTAFGGVKFVKTWKNPEAQPTSWQGKKVAVFARTFLNPNREIAEKALVRELAQRGVQGVLGYTLVPQAVEKDTDAVKRILTENGIIGAVVMSVAGFQEDTVVTSAQTYYLGPNYGSFYGYWGYGASYGFIPGTVDQKQTYMVESLVYSIDQNKLMWAGTSKVVNPKEVDELIKKLASAVASELKKAGLAQK